MTQWLWIIWATAALVWTGLAVLGWIAVRRSKTLRALPSLPPATLVVAVHGWNAFTRQCLDSLLAQRYPGPLDVVLSLQDENAPALPQARRWERDGRAKVVVRSVPKGWSAVCSNYANGVAATEGEVVVLACDDILAAPDVVARLVTRLERGAGIVSAIPLTSQATTLAARVSALFTNASTLFGWAPGVMLGCSAAWGGLMAVRRADLAAVGGVAAVRGRIAEDLALAQAITRLGRPAALGPVVDSPLGPVGWEDTWARIKRLSMIPVRQDPYAGGLSSLAVLSQYFYLGLLPAGILLGRLDLLAGWAAFALVRVGFLAAASRGRVRLRDSVAAALLVDPLHAAGLIRAFLSGRVRWAGREYHVTRGGTLEIR